VKEVLCDSAPTNSCHLLLRWAWLHFKALNLDERSLYLRHEGHEMKLKFITPRQADDMANLISLSLGNQITTTLATSVLPVSSEQNS